jgi:hypothetical protein
MIRVWTETLGEHLVESNSGWVVGLVAFEPPRAYRRIFSEGVPWGLGWPNTDDTRENTIGR